MYAFEYRQGSGIMSILLQDLKYGIRLLLEMPAFTVTAVPSASSSRWQCRPTFRSALVHAQPVDTRAAAAAIMQADRDFNQSVAGRDQKKFLA
jgi:hypothetical protein